jgi:tetratricopeptide (TPR) repeat protein
MFLTKRGKRRLLILLGISAAIAVSAAGVFAMRRAQLARRHVEARADGMAAYEVGDYPAALSRLGSVVGRYPDDVALLLACAESRARVPETNRGHLLAAASLYRAALRVEPANEEALDSLLALYDQLGRRAELVEVADRILAVSPDDVEALSAMAGAAYDGGDLDTVIEIAVRLSALEPQQVPWRALHLTALQDRGADEATVLRMCDDWIAEHARDGRFQLLKAQILADLGRVEEARATVIDAAASGAESRDILRSMLATLDLLGLHDEVPVLLARSTDDGWVLEAAVQYHWQALRLDDALDELARAEETLGALDLRLLGWRALVHADRGALDRAREVTARLRALSSDASPDERDSARAWAEAVIAIHHLAENDWVAAIDASQAAISLRPDDRVLQHLTARTFQRVGEHDYAIELFSRLASREPGSLALQVSLAESLLAVGRTPEAFQVLSRVMRRRPGMPIRAYLVLARAWLGLDAPPDALVMVDLASRRRVGLVELLQQLHAQLGWQAEASALLVEAYVQHDRRSEAIDLVEQALEDPDTPAGVLLALADADARADLGNAVELVAAARARGGLTPGVALAEAGLRARRGDAEDAIAVIDEARPGADGDSAGGEALELARLRMRLETDQPGATAEAIAWLERSSTPALPLLGVDAVWSDQALARAIIEHAKGAFGDRLSQVLLAEAQYIYRFERDDPASIARALDLVGGVLRETRLSKLGLVLMADLQLAADPPQRFEATQTLRTAVDTYRDALPLYPMLVELLQREGDYETARRYLAELTRRLGEDELALRRTAVRLYQAQGDYEDAAGQLASMVDDASSEGDRLWLASLRSRSGDIAGAEAILDRLLRNPRPGNDVIDVTADLYVATGRVDEAVALLESRLDVPDEPSRARRIGELLLRSGAAGEAAPYLRRAAEEDATNVASWIALANLHVAQGDLERADDAIGRGLEIDPANEALLTLRAVTQTARGTLDPDQVLTMLGGLDATSADVARIVRLSDRIGRAAGPDLADAQRLVRDLPGTMAAWRVAIEMHAAAERWDDAIDLARRAADRLPTNPAPAEMATRLLIRRGRADDALEMAYRWRERVLQAPLPADTVIAALLVDAGRGAEAFDRLEPYAERMWDERQRSPDRLETWLTALLATDREAEATRIVERLAAEGPAWRSRLPDIAATLDAQAAERLLRALDGLLADDPVDRMRLAFAWNDLARRTGSDDAYERVSDLASSVAGDQELARAAALMHAVVATARADLARAESLYRALVTEDAVDVIVLNNLADVLVRRGEQCDEAVDFAERATKLADDDPAVGLTLAQALACAGRYPEAELHLRAIVDRGYRHPDVFLTRARVSHARGRTAQAREDLEQARRRASLLDPPDASLPRRLDETARLLGE